MEGQTTKPGVRQVDETSADTRRGGDVRTLLSPKTVGSTSGFMGVATIPAGRAGKSGLERRRAQRLSSSQSLEIGYTTSAKRSSGASDGSFGDALTPPTITGPLSARY